MDLICAIAFLLARPAYTVFEPIHDPGAAATKSDADEAAASRLENVVFSFLIGALIVVLPIGGFLAIVIRIAILFEGDPEAPHRERTVRFLQPLIRWQQTRRYLPVRRRAGRPPSLLR